MGIGRIRWVSELHGIANSPMGMIQIQSHDLLRVDAWDTGSVWVHINVYSVDST